MNNETNTFTQAAVMTTGRDFVTSLLIVSVLANLAVLIAWLLVSVDPTISVAISTI